MQKIILFYKFIPIPDTESVLFWQRALCEKLHLKGRVLISKDGINATLGGDLMSLKYYTREMKAHSLFGRIHWKWSDGSAQDFPRLQVRIRDEIVAFDAVDELKVDQHGVIGGGTRLTPEGLNKLVAEKDVVFYDGRNGWEAEIGHFQNAVIPKVEHSRDFKNDIESGEISHYKDKPIVTYCTGGVRCEILSAMMKNRGYKEVYQLDGGIATYGDEFPNSDLWEGKLFVFDNRMHMSFADRPDIAKCYACGSPTSRQVNSKGVRRKLYVCCENCEAPND